MPAVVDVTVHESFQKLVVRVVGVLILIRALLFWGAVQEYRKPPGPRLRYIAAALEHQRLPA